jgi:UDP-N-acetylmuramoyl-L-alanyl-D-glutamate--2,6-diaminopimelate ligase
MRLFELIKDLDCTSTVDRDIEITGLAYDSRKVRNGDLFFCIRGVSTDGHKYAPSAVENGAVCLMVSEKLDIDVPQIVVKDDRKAMALISKRFYRCPSDDMLMVGITGTSGKTSSTYMMKSVLEEAGYNTGLIGTVHIQYNDMDIPSEHTTPESMDLQKILSDMRDAGVKAVVMEVSSHSLYLDRVYGIRYQGAMFTNLSQDHLDFHGDFESYFRAKEILFHVSDSCAVNADDEYGRRLSRTAEGKLLTYGTERGADVRASEIELYTDHSIFDLEYDGEQRRVRVGMPGAFMVSNSLGVIALSLAMGIDIETVIRGIEKVNHVPGRVENLDTQGRDFSIVLDYCHKPEALEKVLTMLKGYAKGRVVCVFGCGGNRDSLKRPLMGKISEDIADFTIVTSDNPRFEDPEAIIKDITAGMEKDNHMVITDRREAIKYAIHNALKDDVILLAGKGHEDYQEIKGVHYPFDEKVIVKEILDSMN